MEYYDSPRWTNEILDCGMPMTFDTYSNCSYNCSYCFSQFQRGVGKPKEVYRKKEVKYVNVNKIKKMFLNPDKSQFGEYIKKRYVMQWGGLSDQFDEFERKYGITLELMKFFKSIKYPLSFSTKSTWFLRDKRYLDVIKGTKDYWHFKISIITLDEKKVKMVEAGIDSAQERLENFKILKKLGNKATLRLRPFIIGVSDPSYIDLIKKSIKYGIDSVSLEFLCLEERSKNIAEQQYKKISDACGFDVFKFYKQNSSGAGYLRLNYKTKIKYANEIIKLCKRNKVRLAVSDAHLKTLGNCGCCCGVPENWKFFRGQLTNAIQICKKQNKGVTFEDLKPDIDLFKKIKFEKAKGFNTTSNKKRAVFREFSLYDLIRNKWNQPKKGGSPFKYTDKRFIPVKVDKKKNVMYEIR